MHDLMLRLTLSTMLSGALIFGGILGVIRTQGAPQDSLRSLLRSPENGACADQQANNGQPAPCFFDIVPGVTRIDQAIDRLENHPWVGEFQIFRGMEIDSGFLRWSWTGAQPEEIDSRRSGQMWYQRGVIRWLEIPTTLTVGDLWLLLQMPEAGRIHLTSAGDQRVYGVALYYGGRLGARADHDCPLRAAAYWRAPIIVRINSPLDAQTALEGEDHAFQPPRLRRCA